jgi:hypothetical protein
MLLRAHGLIKKVPNIENSGKLREKVVLVQRELEERLRRISELGHSPRMGLGHCTGFQVGCYRFRGRSGWEQ